jgi:hypothetical protein
MTGRYMLLALARNSDRIVNETLITVASISLVVSSVLWIVLSRAILRNLRKRAHVPTASVRVEDRNIWREPPIEPPR